MKMYRLAVALVFILAVAGCGGGSGDLSQSGAITGRAINASGQPVSGAAVSLFPAGRSHLTPVATTTTTVEGNFTFTNVEAGTYTVELQATGPGGGTLEVQVSVTVPAGTTVDITIRVSAESGGVIPGPGTGAISGLVLDEDGDPMIGMRVKAEREPSGPEIETATDGNGRFLLDDLQPGLWKVWADPVGEDRSDFVWIDLEADEEVQTTIHFDD